MAVLLPDLLSPQEQLFLHDVWPRIRVANQFADINWASVGYGSGPPLNPRSYAALAWIWPHVRVAASFSDPTWSNHPIPDYIVGAASPVPEVPDAPAPTVPAYVVPPLPIQIPTGPPASYAGGGGASLFPLDMPQAPQTVAPAQAGMFGNVPLPLVLAMAGGALALFLFGSKGSTSTARRRRR